jgi:hypothetical protein
MFHLHFLFADAVSFVPMKFGITFFAGVQKANSGKSFQLSPPSVSVSLTQPFEITDFTTDSDDLDVFDFADDFK